MIKNSQPNLKLSGKLLQSPVVSYILNFDVVAWLQQQQKSVSIFHQSVCTNSPALLLFASSALSAGTEARPCMNPDPARLSSTRSSWAALSQSRELDYPLALKLHPLSFPLGRGWEAAEGTNTQIFHLLIKEDFSHILTGQMDHCFWKTMDAIQDISSSKNKCCGTFKMLITDTYF